MPFNNLISRSDAAALNTESVSRAMIEEIQNVSGALRLFNRIPVSQAQTRFPVLSALPVAYFVNGDTGQKQTSEMAWSNVYMNVEEIAVIFPVPDAVVEDAQYDIFGAVRPLAANAIARVLDAAVFFGTNKPASWPADIASAAATSSNTVTRGTATQAQGGIAQDFNNLFAKVEADGYGVTGVLTDIVYRSYLRGARDTTGQALLDLQNGTVYGVRLAEAMAGLWPSGSGTVEAFAGDFTKALLGIRRDITFDLSQEAVIQDNAGNIVFNAYQQDLTLLRATFRAGYVMSNPIGYRNQSNATRYPFATMLAA